MLPRGRHALSNALSNARKYGAGRVAVGVHYVAPRLVLQVANGVDAQAQAALLARHGADGTPLLHGRVEGGTALSTNLGSRALLAAAALLGGGVALTFTPDETRLRLEVEAPVAAPVEVGGAAPLVWFLDDEPTMRLRCTPRH